MIEIPTFGTQKELFEYLKLNKNIFLTAKKSALKFSDAVNFGLGTVENDSEIISKASNNVLDISELKTFKVNAVINTTMLMDSHSDVHIDGLWNKSVKEQRNLMLLEEHKMSFKNIISENITATLKKVDWKTLGFNYEGKTQALVFNAEIDKNQNTFMAELYANGKVKNHSVGMRYVKLDLAMNSNSKNDAEEKAVWDKYINEIANKEDAIAQGYFWAVTEAKIIEGSAVPMGSNFATPVLSIGKVEPLNDTQTIIEPSKDTRRKQIISNFIN